MLIPVFYLWFRATAGWVLRVLRHLPIQPDVHKYQKGEHDYPELPQVIVWCQLKGDSTGTTDFLLCDLCGLIESGYDMVIRENKPRLLMFKPLVWEGQTKMDLRGLHQWPVISRHNRSMYMSTSESWKKKPIFYKEKSIISIILEMLQTSWFLSCLGSSTHVVSVSTKDFSLC